MSPSTNQHWIKTLSKNKLTSSWLSVSNSHSGYFRKDFFKWKCNTKNNCSQILHSRVCWKHLLQLVWKKNLKKYARWLECTWIYELGTRKTEKWSICWISKGEYWFHELGNMQAKLETYTSSYFTFIFWEGKITERILKYSLTVKFQAQVIPERESLETILGYDQVESRARAN